MDRHVEGESTSTAADDERRGPSAHARPVPEVETREQHDHEADRHPPTMSMPSGMTSQTTPFTPPGSTPLGVGTAPAGLGVEHPRDAPVLPEVHVPAVQPPRRTGLLVADRVHRPRARIDEGREVGRLLGLGRPLGRRHLAVHLVDAAAVAGQRQAVRGRALRELFQGGVGRGLRADVARRGPVPVAVEPTLDGLVTDQPRARRGDDDHPHHQDQRQPSVHEDQRAPGAHRHLAEGAMGASRTWAWAAAPRRTAPPVPPPTRRPQVRTRHRRRWESTPAARALGLPNTS